LITGGAGFIGSHLVDNLVEKGCKVRVMDNLANGKLENISHHLGQEVFEFFHRDVTDPLDAERAMEGIDVVFHLACLGLRHSIAHPFDTHRVNAEGSLVVLDAAFRAKVDRFVYCSSSEVYGTAQYVPMPESHPTHPCTVYGSSKLAGEAYARAYYRTYGMPTVVVRPFNTYGPRSHHEGDAGELIPKSIVRALNREPILIFGDGSQTRDYTYVEDMVRALVCAAERDAMIGQTLNIGSNSEFSAKDLAHKIADMVRSPDTNISFGPARPGEVLRLYADPRKFIELCGWEPQISLDEGLAKTIEFFRYHPLGLRGLMEGESGRNWEEDYL
jgi:UDP-glucose 4-epimerase